MVRPARHDMGAVLGDSPRERLFEVTRGLEAQAVEGWVARAAGLKAGK